MYRIQKNDSLDLVCLGVGNGSSHVLKGLPSSAFVLNLNKKPFILIDCGLGVVKSFHDLLGLEKFPDKIYLTHNHTDHTGDLPVLLAVFKKFKGYVPTVYGHTDVLEIVKKHRMHELLLNGKTNDDYAVWKEADSNQEIKLLDNLKLITFKSKHSYTCYGFHLLLDNVNILSYSADSGYDEAIFHSLSSSPVIIMDGRDNGSKEHASLKSIDDFGKINHYSKIFVLHYESTGYIPSSPNVQLWHKGHEVKIH